MTAEVIDGPQSVVFDEAENRLHAQKSILGLVPVFERGTSGGLPSAIDWDRVLPFQLDALGVRGRLVRLGPALDEVIERHGYPLAVARPLAEAMVLCATLATSLKYDGIFTLQITGDGPIRLLVTDLTSDGALRGYAQFDSWKLAIALGSGNEDAPDGYVPKLFGQGRLTFTVDQGQHTERYQGVVPLEGATLADCAHTYFRQSEQLPTGIKITARRSDASGSASLACRRADGAADARVRCRPPRRRRRAARGRLAQGRHPDGLGHREGNARPGAARHDAAASPVPPGAAARLRAPRLCGALPLQPRAHRPRAALESGARNWATCATRPVASR